MLDIYIFENSVFKILFYKYNRYTYIIYILIIVLKYLTLELFNKYLRQIKILCTADFYNCTECLVGK